MFTYIRTRRGAWVAARRWAKTALLVAVSVAPTLATSLPIDDLDVGAKLFSDPRLNADGTISCASCHVPSKAFADGKAVAIGLRGQAGVRNTPSLLTVNLQSSFFWDGRRTSLAAQVLDPFVNHMEHGLASLDEVVRTIDGAEDYPRPFRENLGIERVARALAQYVSSLDRSPSRFDRYWFHGDKNALSEAELQGFEIFRGPGGCTQCHRVNDSAASFTDNDFHSVGIAQRKLGSRLAEIATRSVNASPEERERLITSDATVAALGRFNVTGKPADIGKYRTPSLRNVAITAPYMHDGSVASLEEAVDLEIYYRAAQLGRPLILTPQEKKSLAAFLRSLTTETAERAEGCQ